MSLSYQLAMLLVRPLLRDRKRCRRFLASAECGDAGERAAREHLGVSLGELVGSFLGPGDWAPRPAGPA